MSEAKDGGSAFPEPLGDVSGRQYAPDPGMSLRDYFAARALNAVIGKLPLLKDRDPNDVAPEVPLVTEDLGLAIRRQLAEVAYLYADAMLEARKK